MQSQKRTFSERIVHAVGFEVIAIAICAPLAAWMLNISLLQAFMVEIGFFLFFLPYSVIYNWAYDALRARWVSASA